MVADFAAFLRFVNHRSFELTPRTLGLGRRELHEVNGLMRRRMPTGTSGGVGAGGG